MRSCKNHHTLTMTLRHRSQAQNWTYSIYSVQFQARSWCWWHTMLNLDLEGCFYNNFRHFPRNFLSQIKEVKSCAKDREQFGNKKWSNVMRVIEEAKPLRWKFERHKKLLLQLSSHQNKFWIGNWGVVSPGSMGSFWLVMKFAIISTVLICAK